MKDSSDENAADKRTQTRIKNDAYQRFQRSTAAHITFVDVYLVFFDTCACNNLTIKSASAPFFEAGEN